MPIESYLRKYDINYNGMSQYDSFEDYTQSLKSIDNSS